MSESEVTEDLAQRLLTTQTFWGRVRLNSYSIWKRNSWRIAVSWALIAKRGFDVVCSAILMIFSAPIFAVIGLLIKLEDRGPVFFVQKRVGRGGQEFDMLKFRSMCINAEARINDLISKNQHSQGVTFKMKNDPRVTKVGKWLRKLSLDELPQLINVFKGDMSLVGPRPPLPREVALYSMADRRRLAVTPGITCFWQIGGRSEIDFPGQVQLDVQYIESQTFWTDLKILFKTIPAVIMSKGAY